MDLQINSDEIIVDNFSGGGNPYTKEKQTARCGNAVTPPVATALVRANLPEICGEINNGGNE